MSDMSNVESIPMESHESGRLGLLAGSGRPTRKMTSDTHSKHSQGANGRCATVLTPPKSLTLYPNPKSNHNPIFDSN